jgi:phage terminase small subunit
MKLTLKQKKFCQLFAATGNATFSAKGAGYSKKTAKFIGCQNLTKLYLVEYIKELGQADEANRIANILERNVLLSSIIRNEDGDTGISTSDRIRAIDLLNKATGVYLNDKNSVANSKSALKYDVTFSPLPITLGGDDCCKDLFPMHLHD